MVIFITGATGYIGQRLTLSLAAAGHTVRVLVRSPDKAKHMLTHPQVSFVSGTLNDLAALKQGTVGCDAIFHLAAYARVWAADPREYDRINVEGTENVLRAAVQNNVQKVVVTSTAGAVGPSYQGPVSEDTERKAPFFNEYEETKSRSEEICRAYARRGLHVVVVSPSRVYGPGFNSASNAVTKMISLYIRGKWRWIPGDGQGKGNYVYVDDVVQGHLLAWEKGRPGEIYLLGGENASYDVFFRKVRQISGVRRRLFHIPLRLMLALSKMMVTWTRLSGQPPLITPPWVQKYMHHWEVSSQKAIRELGYSITPLEQGIAQTIQWVRAT